jgi:hypothetical protein
MSMRSKWDGCGATARSENAIDDLGGVFRLFLKQALYESVLVAFIVAVIPSDRSSLFDGSEHPG